MLVSVIIPVYNGEKFINKVYNSIKKQTYQNIEIIFFNDNSKDNSLKILKEIQKSDSKVEIYSSKENKGPGGAKNEGLKHAKGDYVFFIDCDDYLNNDFIASLVNKAILENYPDVILSDFTKVDEKGKILYVRNYKNLDKAIKQKITTWGKLIKRDFIINNNLELPYGPVLEDLLYSTSFILLNTKYSYIDNAGYNYVLNKNSITNTTFKKFKEDSLKMATNYLLNLKNRNDFLEPEKLTYYAYKYICWHLLKSGNNVKTEAMRNEYQMAFNFLKKEFPNYKKFKYLDLKNERFIVKIVLWNILLLHKIHLDWLFFKIYSNIDLGKLWPNL